MSRRTLTIVFTGLLVAGSVAAPAQAARSECFGRKATIVGSDRRDRVTGTSGDDVIIGGNGDDRIDGGGGDDRICAGQGNDVVDAGGGRDFVLGGLSDDEIRGGPGADVIDGDSQHDVLHGNGGNDRIHTGEPGDGDEYAYGGLGRDVIVKSGESFGYLFGNKGDDRLVANGAYDFLEGGPGDDRIEGGSASFAESPDPITADIGAGTATGAGSDTLVDVRGLSGSAFDDVLTGGAADDLLLGRGGDDMVTGGAGDDELIGGTGADVVSGEEDDDEIAERGPDCRLPGSCLEDAAPDEYSGGPGLDALDFSGSAARGVTVDLAAGTARGAGDDTLTGIEDLLGTQSTDTLLGDDGPNDIYAGYGGSGDRIEGRGGDDTLTDSLTPSTNDATDVFDGGAGDDTITGWEGNDRLIGGDGADSISDPLGENRVEGGAGDDTLFAYVDGDAYDGGAGTDFIDYSTAQLYGGSGVTVDLAAGTSTVQRGTPDSLVAIENVRGSGLDDDLFGDDGPNVIEGVGSDDSLDGRGGTDSLDGGPGFDECVNGETTARCEI